ncbi:DUF4336 domain-containing protein [Consotaella salsifontis]|uniref:DUF4336 domain-containing protein n=1 Tax=Consotaella salsifontis TaxID=1365950 RepID=A0A1T4SR82_9HYPH|nr:DUF4336 domain-containing protein [Consotaella salsifontis]SKA30408.1 protein of unknown function [Consotaella salsifontis]
MARDPTYAPLFTLKPLDHDIWIADGETIDFGLGGMTMPFPTRMTVIRLDEGLFVHSPIALPAPLKEEIDAVGEVRFIAAPNRIHYWWMPDWHAAYPQAQCWLAPRITSQAKGRIDFPCLSMPAESYPWDHAIATFAAPGDYMTEMVFFHGASRSLILTDLIENFEAHKLSWWTAPLARLAGIVSPHGSTPRDMRLTYRHHRQEIGSLVRHLIALEPQRIVVAHGRIIQGDCREALKSAFSWALKA